MKALVKTIAFLIFWIHIIHEGHIYIFNILKICDSIFITKIFQNVNLFLKNMGHKVKDY
jgi:hypothetical protein